MTVDADRPADVREVIKSWLDEPPSTCDCDECVTSFLAALSAAGLAVVPAGEQREEWGYRIAPDNRIWEMAGDAVQRVAARHSGVLPYRRTVHVGSWQPVDPP